MRKTLYEFDYVNSALITMEGDRYQLDGGGCTTACTWILSAVLDVQIMNGKTVIQNLQTGAYVTAI